MTYAIIETGGKQLRVEPGRFYNIELLPVEPDQSITLEKVLLVQHNGDVSVGQPFVDGATVEGTVMRHFRGRKVLVYKMKPKKKTRKKRGHRQEITRLMINSISLNGSVIASETAEPEETQAAVATLVAEESAGETYTPEQTQAPVEAATITVDATRVAEEPAVEASTSEETNQTESE
jgi:large subunit ribosomal protein L21